jgi:hypothetical protein
MQESSFKIVTAEEYFTEAVKESAAKNKIQMEPEDQVYLTHILVKYIPSISFHRPIQEDSLSAPPTTFAEIYLTALGSDEPRKKELLQIVGDKSLYLIGYFPESISKKPVNESYYASIGSAAYRNLHALSRNKGLSGLYRRFAGRFMDFANILKQIKKKE